MSKIKEYLWGDREEDLEALRDRIFPAEQLKVTGFFRFFVSVPCIVLTLITLYMAFYLTFGNMGTRSFHLGIVAPLILLLYPAIGRWKGRGPTWIDYVLAALAAMTFFYTFYNADRFGDRAPYVDPMEPMDMFMGIVAVLIVLEITRRTIGMIIVWLTVFFFIYALTGPMWPGLFEHRGVDIPSLVEFLYTLDEGMFNFLMGIMATYLFTFLTFATFLRASGADRFFTDFALAAAGHRRGGPAKVAVISSSLMGMLSGSSISNVVTTGSLTIPLMKRTGFKPYEAGAIETVASVGGGITPPLMGAAVFVMSEFTDIRLITIINYSILPAILFYTSLYFYVDVKARKNGLVGLPRDELPVIKQVLLDGGHIFLPIFVLVYLLIIDFTPFYASSVCVLLTFAVSFLREGTRLTPRKFLLALEAATRVVLPVTPLLASAAIIYGIINVTGLLVKVTSILLAFAGGSSLIGILLIAAMSYVVGMGLPTTAAYVIIAVLGAPALSELGLSMLAAHMVILWFSMDSSITPPIAMTAFVGARIAGANPHRTGFECVIIAKALYIIPFVFAYGNLLDESIPEILFDFAVLFCTFATMPLAVEGYWNRKLTVIERLTFFATAAVSLYATFGPMSEGVPSLIVALVILGGGVYLLRRPGPAASVPR